MKSYKEFMKYGKFYPFICIVCAFAALFSLCAADISRKKLAGMPGEVKKRAEDLIKRNAEEINYRLSVISWTHDDRLYNESVNRICSACGEIRGALGVYAARHADLYRSYSDSIERFALSLPSENSARVRDLCLEVKEKNRDLYSAVKDGADPETTENALISAIGGIGRIFYRESSIPQSSEAFLAIRSAPEDISSA